MHDKEQRWQIRQNLSRSRLLPSGWGRYCRGRHQVIVARCRLSSIHFIGGVSFLHVSFVSTCHPSTRLSHSSNMMIRGWSRHQYFVLCFFHFSFLAAVFIVSSTQALPNLSSQAKVGVSCIVTWRTGHPITSQHPHLLYNTHAMSERSGMERISSREQDERRVTNHTPKEKCDKKWVD